MHAYVQLSKDVAAPHLVVHLCRRQKRDQARPRHWVADGTDGMPGCQRGGQLPRQSPSPSSHPVCRHKPLRDKTRDILGHGTPRPRRAGQECGKYFRVYPMTRTLCRCLRSRAVAAACVTPSSVADATPASTCCVQVEGVRTDCLGTTLDFVGRSQSRL